CERIHKTQQDLVCEFKTPLRVVADGPLSIPGAGHLPGPNAYEIKPTGPRLTITSGSAVLVDIGLKPYLRPPWLTEAHSLRRAGKDRDADAVAVLIDPESASERAARLGQLGRNALARGDVARATDCLDEAVRLHDAEGELSQATDDAFALAYVLSGRGHDH